MAANGWNEYQKLVISELALLRTEARRIETKLDERADHFEKLIGNQRTEIALLKLKSGLWGLTAGLVGAVAVALVSN